jgi:hypothetical protein
MVHRDQADYNNEVWNIADKLNICDNGVLVKLKHNEWWRCMESVLLNCWRLGIVYNVNLCRHSGRECVDYNLCINCSLCINPSLCEAEPVVLCT